MVILAYNTGMRQKVRLWVDDNRHAPEGWLLAKTSKDAINILLTQQVDEISLDYSLAYMEIDTARPILEWMKENYFPAVIDVHTGSPSGQAWLVEQIKTHAPGHLREVYSAFNSNW